MAIRVVQYFKSLSRRYLKLKLGLSPQQNLFYGFLTYIVAGFLLLLLPWAQARPISVIDNLFIATSAVSTTGLVTVGISESYTGFGQFVIMCLFQLGGIGYLTFTTFMLLSTTRRLTHWHKKILTSEFTLPVTIKISDFLRSVIIFTVIMEAIGTVLFYIAFSKEGYNTGDALWNALFHSISAFCTAGFSILPNGFEPFSDNTLVNSIISILAIAGSLGFIVVTDLAFKIKSKSHRLSFTTKIVGIGFILLLGIGSVFLFLTEPSIQSLNDKERFLASFFQTMSAMTTVGFNTMDYGTFVLPVLLMVIFLMYIGASPSGTAGGMKITTLTAMLAIVGSRLRGKKRIAFLGKRIPFERLYIATSSFIFYTSIIGLGTFLMTLSEHFEFERILFEVASALGTVGLSTGITGELSLFGKVVITVLMFIGRLGVLTFGLAILAQKPKNTDQDFIVEEDLAV